MLQLIRCRAMLLEMNVKQLVTGLVALRGEDQLMLFKILSHLEVSSKPNSVSTWATILTLHAGVIFDMVHIIWRKARAHLGKVFPPVSVASRKLTPRTEAEKISSCTSQLVHICR